MQDCNRKSTFCTLGGDFDEIIGQIVSVKVKTLSDRNLVASRKEGRRKESGMGGQQTRPLHNICLAHFLKTNLWKYADISVKRRQKAEAFWDR